MRYKASQDQFLLEALENVRFVRKLSPDHFQSHHAVQLAIHGFVHGAHAAFAEHFQDFVAVG